MVIIVFETRDRIQEEEMERRNDEKNKQHLYYYPAPVCAAFKKSAANYAIYY